MGPNRPRAEFQLRLMWAAAAIALLAAGVSVGAVSAGSSSRAPKISAVRANADAHVSAAAQSTNFGKLRTLPIDARPLKRAYLRFDIDLKRKNVSRINLLLYSRTRSQLGYQIRLVTRKWRERRITYANAPRVSPRLMSSGPVRARSWKAVDITALVEDEDDEVKLALTTVAPAGIVFASRESGLTGPRLVVEREEDETKRPSTEPPPPPVTP